MKLLENKRQVATTMAFTAYWFIAFIFFHSFYGGRESDSQISLTFTGIFWFISFACVDIHYRFVTKPNLQAKRYYRLVMFSIFIFMAAFWLESVLSFTLHLFFWDYENGTVSQQLGKIHYQVGGVNMIVFGGVAFRFMLESYRLVQQKEEQERTLFESELKLREVELEALKNQVNPHFLFNALNCVYGLSLEKSERTPQVILQLSDMLDYMLYKCQRQVLISEELKQIENYIAIQQLRFGSALELTLQMDVVDDMEMAPLLLLPLVENAFKHGRPDESGVMHISIAANCEDNIDFSVKNSVDCTDESNASGGIGLANLRRRLELLYPHEYRLEVVCEHNAYVVNLTLNCPRL